VRSVRWSSALLPFPVADEGAYSLSPSSFRDATQWRARNPYAAAMVMDSGLALCAPRNGRRISDLIIKQRGYKQPSVIARMFEAPGTPSSLSPPIKRGEWRADRRCLIGSTRSSCGRARRRPARHRRISPPAYLRRSPSGGGPRFLTEVLRPRGQPAPGRGSSNVPGGSPDAARGSRPTKPRDAGAASRSIDRRHRLTPLVERDERIIRRTNRPGINFLLAGNAGGARCGNPIIPDRHISPRYRGTSI
jgi:hypothetical protein